MRVRTESRTCGLNRDRLVRPRRNLAPLRSVVRRGVGTAFENLGLAPLFSVEDYYARYDEFARRCDSIDDLRRECFAALAEENGYDRGLGRDVAAAFAAERDQSNVELLPSVADVLDDLADNYRLGIVTNGARDAQRQKIAAVGLERWIDAVVVTGHEIPPIPDPEPFERVLRALETTPETTVHVGDSLETDVAGAAAAGLESGG
ncbi:HAD family hydrolase [Natronobacterium gregoryi]|uniref:Haloacid dehalogenase n=2 Tax=Natronobacterium gregoryi TaxID=44930 RepID=L0AKE6_NATGS|nr:HAD-IA family hydrolase [Natronobacterium gregoryi]AFZ74373.1 haloacid dehalogenase superfamily enzyme, subfamily IA [Natronobacterium gregoryi SP2]ELY63340.1 haloacid dehalogenase [Natronobacterium gregoryi SP2]PLK22117.1 haloacid dehalogenase [Natronobacterium gregoryi SP2]SFI54696.1 putative hydrolase of the HAD superfamily [Natronobacterium gregoryi]